MIDFKHSATFPFALSAASWPALLLLVLIFLQVERLSAQELYVEGSFKKNIYFDGKVYEEPTVHFNVKEVGANWQIQYSTWLGERAYDYAEGQYHGTNLSLAVFIGSSVKAQLDKGSNMAPNVALGTIYRGEVPNIKDNDDLGVIWLAYVSGSYFEKQTNHLAEPPFERDVNSARHFGPPGHAKMRAQWSLTDTTPNFISNLAYFDDGYAMNSKGELVRRPAPYDIGFTNSTYDVSTFTNIGYLKIPLTASLRVFRTKSKAMTNTDLDTLFEYRINLEKVSLHVQDMAQEQWLPITAVQDFRVKTDSGEPYALYYATNRFPTDEETRKMLVLGGVFIRNTGIAHEIFIKNITKSILYIVLIMPAFVLFFKFTKGGKSKS